MNVDNVKNLNTTETAAPKENGDVKKTSNSNLFDIKEDKKDTVSNAVLMCPGLDIGALGEKVEYLAENYKALRDAGARSVTGVALLAQNKGQEVMNNTISKAEGFAYLLNNIINDESLSEDERKEKIEEIENKISAIQQEASAKLDILMTLSDAVFEMHRVTIHLKGSGISASDVMEFMMGMIQGLDANLGEYGGAKSKEDIEKQLAEAMDKAYGKNSTEKLKEKENDLKEKIEKLNEELKKDDITDEQKEKIGLQLEVYNFELTVIGSVLAILSRFSQNENEDN